jgi:hypothetical protein
MRNADVQLNRTVVYPAEAVKEADVAGLDVGDHLDAAQRRRRGRGEADQRLAQSINPKGGEH